MRGQPAISANVYLKSSSIKVLVVMELTIKNVDEIKRDRLSKKQKTIPLETYLLAVMYYVSGFP